jgi:hypothetical protein
VPLARAAAAFVRREPWFIFGFARLQDHARERFGRSGRWVKDLASLGRALDSLPGLADALTGDDGGLPIGRVAAILIGRIASAPSLPAWIDLARTVPVRHLREAIRRARAAGSEWPCPGETPASASPNRPIEDAARPVEPVGSAADDDDPADRSLVSIPVPSPVMAAFDEAAELYRAVQGTEATLTSFVEALVAEALAGDRPPGVDQIPLAKGIDSATVESALARSTGTWQHLPPPAASSGELALAGLSLDRLGRLTRQVGTGGPADLDGQLRALISLEAEIEGRLGRLLAEMSERGAWSRLRFASVGHYAEQRLGLSRTTAEDRARAARLLRRFPLLEAAYEGGRIGLEATLLVLRILGHGPVDRRAEMTWVRRAEEATVKRLRDEARAIARARHAIGDAGGGSTPGDSSAGSGSPVPGASRHPLPLDDRAWHASLRREAGTARRRIIRYGLEAVPGDARPLSGPDVFLRLRLPGDLAARFLAAIESSRRALAAAADEVPWDELWPDPGALPSLLAARTFSIRCRRAPAWVGLLALIEDFALTWDADDGAPARRSDRIYVRDGWRCTAPGCTSRRNLEDHHLHYRSRRGSDHAPNRTCLCRFHHQRGEHGELASCRGAAPTGILWRVGRRDVASWYRNERRIAAPTLRARPPLAPAHFESHRAVDLARMGGAPTRVRQGGSPP